jgi:hypothetical protein
MTIAALCYQALDHHPRTVKDRERPCVPDPATGVIEYADPTREAKP